MRAAYHTCRLYKTMIITDATTFAVLASKPLFVMHTDASTLAVLASRPYIIMVTNASTLAVLAFIPLTLMLTQKPYTVPETQLAFWILVPFAFSSFSRLH